jgi:hypothetical protein
MVEMVLQPMSHRASRAALTLVGLVSMPCGCVSGIYQANPTVVELELVEAKGPHCVYDEHRLGGVVRLGLPEEILEPGNETTV